MIAGLGSTLIVGLLLGAARVPSSLSIYERSSGLRIAFIRGLRDGLLFGVFTGFKYGGLAVIQHFILRFVLHLSNHVPWNYARFLDYATERIFLRKVGGGYIFVHRMLQEYFASLAETTTKEIAQ